MSKYIVNIGAGRGERVAVLVSLAGLASLAGWEYLLLVAIVVALGILFDVEVRP